MTLTLKPATKGKKVSNLPVGKILAGTVTQKSDDGLKLRVRKLEGAAILPTLHLSEHPKLCPLLLGMFKSIYIIVPEASKIVRTGSFIDPSKLLDLMREDLYFNAF